MIAVRIPAVLAVLLAVTLGAQSPDNRTVFEQGQQALNRGDLAGAEKAFRQVLRTEPDNVGAHGNLAVVYMRRREWPKALEQLHAAERLAPGMPGIHLNIGLAYYRQADYQRAIPPFETVLRDLPDSTQARYLLGLCYFFTEHYSEAVRTLQPLWNQESQNLSYLYVMAIAASKAGENDLDRQATSRLLEVGKNSSELHLLIGKGHLAQSMYDQALAEFAEAERLNPKEPFVHYFTATVYLKRNDYQHAKEEFLKDAAIEPDMAYDYDQLGALCSTLNQLPEAERYYRKAITLGPRLATSQFGLAKIYKVEGKYAEALNALREAAAIDPQSASVHYLSGQVLLAMGRRAEARREFDETERLKKSIEDELQKKMSGQHVPDPQLAGEK